MKTPIKKIVLDLGGKEVELTLDQAKTLFGALEEMFGSKTTVTPIYVERRRWVWDHPQPFWASPLTLKDGASITGLKAIMNDNGTLKLSC